MRKKSLVTYLIVAAVAFSVFAGAVPSNIYAAKSSTNLTNSDSTDGDTPDVTAEPTDTETDGTEKTDSNSDSKNNKNDKTDTTEAESDTTVSKTKDDSTATTTSSDDTSTSKKKKTTTSNSSASSKTDAKGNTILMTEKERHKKFLSKTNPKRGTKPANAVNRPAYLGFTYADFGTFNSYSSDNGLGGTPVYLLGTIMEIEKVAENVSYYQTVLLVNDCDGYQWYMRVDIEKSKYDMFKAQYLGKAGYIYGIYSGYSGVTNRPMIDVTILHITGGVPTNMALYR